MSAQGVDVSHHQGSIDWPRVRADGQEFAFCKATEGVSFVDSRYQANIAQARATGMVVGAYHFLRAGTSAAQQAHHFLDIIGPPTDLMTALDVETGAYGTKPTGAHAHEFAVEFARLTGGHPLVLYTGRWYWSGVLGNPYGADIGPLWHSAFTATPGPLYGGWPAFTFWQFTSSGVVPGISGGCDLNTFYGSHAELIALTGTTQPQPPPPTLPERHDMLFTDVNNGAIYLGGPGYWTHVGDPIAAEVLSRENAYGPPVGVNGPQVEAVKAAFLAGQSADDAEMAALAGQVTDAVVAALPVGSDLTAAQVQAATEAGVRSVLGGLDDPAPAS